MTDTIPAAATGLSNIIAFPLSQTRRPQFRDPLGRRSVASSDPLDPLGPRSAAFRDPLDPLLAAFLKMYQGPKPHDPQLADILHGGAWFGLGVDCSLTLLMHDKTDREFLTMMASYVDGSPKALQGMLDRHKTRRKSLQRLLAMFRASDRRVAAARDVLLAARED
jgi:hypothetical protein